METEKAMELCGLCEAKLAEGYSLKRIAGGINNKITCANCGRRRYGGTFSVKKKTKGTLAEA